MSTIDQASANAAPSNILAIYTAKMSAPGEQGKWFRNFPVAGQEEARAFNRPHGTVQLLIGMALLSLHSRDRHKAGDLRLYMTVFHPGWVLTGRVSSQDKIFFADHSCR